MAGRIPQTFIDDLLTRVDIVDVIDTYLPLKRTGKNHQALCPFHEEKTPSFTVSQDKQFYHCFGCGANGTAIAFLMDYNGMGFIEAIEELAKRCGLEIPQDPHYQAKAHQTAELYELLERIIRHYQRQLREQGAKAMDYLRQRGIADGIINDYELGYAPSGWESLLSALGQSDGAQRRLAKTGMIIRRDDGGYYDRFRERIMFPIRDQRGRAIGFGGRVLGDNTPKYLNTPQTPLFHKSRELYGLYQAKQKLKQLERLYIVEGYMDVIALAQHGVFNVVATLGTATSADHIARLFRATTQIIFCFDGDVAGKKAAWRALEVTLPHLQEGRQALFHFMPQGHDPDSLVRQHGAGEFQSDENPVPLSDFLLSTVKAETGIASREDRAKFLDRIVPHIARIPKSGIRQLLLQDVARVADIATTHLQDLLAGKQTVAPVVQKRPQRPGQRQNRNLIGELISYILSKPELAMSVEDIDELAETPTAGVDFLIELIGLIHAKPRINCAAILEHWRDTPYAQRLNELAPDTDALTEASFDLDVQFRDALEKLMAYKEKHRIEKIAQANPSDLSAEEKAKLRQRYTAN